MMKVLVVGGEEGSFAIIWKLSQSPTIRSLFAPGNAGIGEWPLCVDIEAGYKSMVQFSRIIMLLIWSCNSDDPLALGMVDAMEGPI